MAQTPRQNPRTQPSPSPSPPASSDGFNAASACLLNLLPLYSFPQPMSSGKTERDQVGAAQPLDLCLLQNISPLFGQRCASAPCNPPRGEGEADGSWPGGRGAPARGSGGQAAGRGLFGVSLPKSGWLEVLGGPPSSHLPQGLERPHRRGELHLVEGTKQDGCRGSSLVFWWRKSILASSTAVAERPARHHLQHVTSYICRTGANLPSDRRIPFPLAFGALQQTASTRGRSPDGDTGGTKCADSNSCSSAWWQR